MSAATHARRVVDAVTAAVGAAAAVLAVALAIGVMLGHWEVDTVVSGSMEPHLRVGSAIVLTPESLTAVRPGQVVAFASPLNRQTVVVHRLVAVTPTDAGTLMVRTRGDANNAADPWQVTLSAPVMRVRASVPLVGYPLLTLRALRWRLDGPLVAAVAAAVYLTRRKTRHRSDVVDV